MHTLTFLLLAYALAPPPFTVLPMSHFLIKPTYVYTNQAVVEEETEIVTGYLFHVGGGGASDAPPTLPVKAAAAIESVGRPALPGVGVTSVDAVETYGIVDEASGAIYVGGSAAPPAPGGAAAAEIVYATPLEDGRRVVPRVPNLIYQSADGPPSDGRSLVRVPNVIYEPAANNIYDTGVRSNSNSGPTTTRNGGGGDHYDANSVPNAEYNGYDADVPAAPGQVTRTAGVAKLARSVNHHGDIERTLAERRLKTAGRCRYLLRNKTGCGNGGVVVSYVGTNGKCAHSQITAVDGMFFQDKIPLLTSGGGCGGGELGGAAPSTLSAAIDAALVVIQTRVKKPMYPVRDPTAKHNNGGRLDPATTHASGYVNTTYEVMAAAASELPVMDRFEAEQKLATCVDGGFILRRKADEAVRNTYSITCHMYTCLYGTSFFLP